MRRFWVVFYAVLLGDVVGAALGRPVWGGWWNPGDRIDLAVLAGMLAFFATSRD